MENGERVNSRVLGDAKNRIAFGVNAPLDTYFYDIMMSNFKDDHET